MTWVKSNREHLGLEVKTWVSRLLQTRVYAYYSTRTWMLALTLASTLLWVIYGFDGTIEELWVGTSTYGTGVHISTIQTFAFFSYLLTVNVQKGGISLITLLDAIRLDIRTNLAEIRYRVSFLIGGKDLARERFRQLREQSEAHGPVGSLRGYAFTFLLVAGALTAFECVWVPLYDYFNFGNWAWPVYFASVDNIGPLPWGSFALIRNVGVTALGFGFALLCLFGTFEKFRDEKGVLQIRRRLQVRWRFDGLWVGFAVITAFLWMYWVLAPFPHSAFTPETLSIGAVINSQPIPSDLLTRGVVFPAQRMFPQTDYTFYLAQDYMKGYPLSRVFGFYSSNFVIHFLNVAVKYATYLTLCYPALVRVRVA